METNASIKTLLGFSIAMAASGPMPAQEPKSAQASKAAERVPLEGGEPTPAKAVSLLVEQLRRHSPKPTVAADRLGLYMIDVTNGEVTLIADQPGPGLTQCGSPTWSNDGSKILYDATPGTQFNLTHLEAFELVQGRLVLTELGPGNCPTFSPTNDRIAFLLNAGAVLDTESGVWMMQADGLNRRLLGTYGVPKWSPYGRQLMIISFSTPREVIVMDARPEKSGVLRIPDYKIYSVTNWAGDETIVAIIGSDDVGAGDTIALIDVGDPEHGKIKEVLWKREKGRDVKLHYPVYSPITRRCVFGLEESRGMALYSFLHGRPDPPRRLEPDGFDHKITGLAYSPDGRYVLFSSDRTEQRTRGPQPGRDDTERQNSKVGESRKTP